MKSALVLSATLLGTVVAAPALARADQFEEAPETPPLNGKAGNVAIQFDLLPLGHVSFKETTLNGRPTDSLDLTTAYGVGIQLNYAVSTHFSLGAAPRLVFNVKADGDNAAAKEFDLRARATLHTASDVSPVFQFFAFAEPGYSYYFVDERDWPTGVDTPTGPVLAFGGGFNYDASSSMFVSAEIGYQLGFQSIRSMARDADFGFNYLHVGLGVGTRF